MKKALIALCLVLTPVSYGQTYESLLTDPDLIARWNGDADDNGTGDADDLVGAADGTWTGTASYTDPPTGKGDGKAFVFDGSSDIDCGNVAPYPDATDFSISFWVRESNFNTGTTSKFFVAQSNGFETGWGIRSSNGSALGGPKISGFCGNMPGTGGMAATGDRSLDTWHFVTLEYDATAGTARISLDGTFTATTDVDTETQFTNLSIGSRNGIGLFPFTGDLYDLRVWDRKLTAGDISALMAGPSTGNPLLLQLLLTSLVFTISLAYFTRRRGQ